MIFEYGLLAVLIQRILIGFEAILENIIHPISLGSGGRTDGQAKLII